MKMFIFACLTALTTIQIYAAEEIQREYLGTKRSNPEKHLSRKTNTLNAYEQEREQFYEKRALCKKIVKVAQKSILNIERMNILFDSLSQQTGKDPLLLAVEIATLGTINYAKRKMENLEDRAKRKKIALLHEMEQKLTKFAKNERYVLPLGYEYLTDALFVVPVLELAAEGWQEAFRYKIDKGLRSRQWVALSLVLNKDLYKNNVTNAVSVRNTRCLKNLMELNVYSYPHYVNVFGDIRGHLNSLIDIELSHFKKKSYKKLFFEIATEHHPEELHRWSKNGYSEPRDINEQCVIVNVLVKMGAVPSQKTVDSLLKKYKNTQIVNVIGGHGTIAGYYDDGVFYTGSYSPSWAGNDISGSDGHVVVNTDNKPCLGLGFPYGRDPRL